MTPSEQQIIDQLRAAAAEWMARRKQDGPLGAANGVPPAPAAERSPVYEQGTQDGLAGESEETA